MSTQHRDEIYLPTKLDRVKQRVQQDPETVFNNLGHIINLDLLERCHHSLDGSKAVGIDGVTKREYETSLEENLQQLLTKIRRGSYHPKASRIVEIPKSDGSKRPLAISCHEDKIVQEAVKRILETIYEPLFLDCSHGFRPNRGCDTALVKLNQYLNKWDCRAILEIDLQKYFNTIPHDQLIKMLEMKISDQRFLHLIIKLLKSPTLNAEGVEVRNKIGSAQGSICSPLLANLYLHYALDVWFEWLNKEKYGNGAHIIRYADDVVFTFRNLAEAEQFKIILEKRLNEFGITINESKTKALICGQVEAAKAEARGERMPTFTFLGFMHVWGISVNRKTGKKFWRIKLRTCPIRFRKKLAEIKEWIRKNFHRKDLLPRMKSVAEGYLNYFAVNDNSKRIHQFICEIKRMLFKYLNRRSQKKSLKWPRFNEILKKIKFPVPRIRKHLFFDLRSPDNKTGVCR